MALRYFANGPITSLVGAIGASDTIITVAAVSQFPTQFPYTIILDYEQITEEICDVTAAVGAQLTITRGADSSTAFAHSAGAVVAHGVTARDHRESNTHVNATSGVHGVAGSVVGTSDSQTLTNKTLTSPILNTPTINTPTINTATSNSPNLKNAIATPLAVANIALKVRGLLGQTSDVFQVNDSTETSLFRISAVGRVGVNTAPGSGVGLFVKNVAGDTNDVTFRIQLLASQTGDPISVVDNASQSQFRVNVSGHVFTSQVQALTTSLSLGTVDGSIVALGSGAATTVSISGGGAATNIGLAGGVIQIGSNGVGGGSQVNINQNGAALVSLPGGCKTLTGGEGIVASDTSPGIPPTARAIWINTTNGVVAYWNGASWVAGP